MARGEERLSKILQYHAYLEEEGKRDLRTLQARWNRARGQLNLLRNAYERRARRREGEALQQSADLVRAQTYAERLRRDLAQQEQAVERAEAALVEARGRLTAAAQKRVASERLLKRRQEVSEDRRFADEQEGLDARGRLQRAQEVD